MPDKPNASPRAWQRMLSGRRLDLLDPSPFDVEIQDIAHGLARVARWNGQTIGDYPFSVAQHSLLVLDIALEIEPHLDPVSSLVVLLHDAPEYVIGDMISPFKAIIGDSYKSVEKRILGAIHIRFGLPPVPAVKVTRLAKRADQVAAFIEATRLAGFGIAEAQKIFAQPRGLGDLNRFDVTPMPTSRAERVFLERFSRFEIV